MMKPTFKSITGLLLCAGLLFSCSTEDNEEAEQLSALEKELQQEHSGLIEIENSTYLFKNTETAKFQDGELDYSFNYSSELEFEVRDPSSRHPGTEIVVRNPASDETIEFTHIVEISNGYKFNLKFSNGTVINSVKYFPTQERIEKWHDMLAFEPESDLIGALVESANTSHNATASCRAAVNVCNRSGGRALVNFHSAALWFSTAAACDVQCGD